MTKIVELGSQLFLTTHFAKAWSSSHLGHYIIYILNHPFSIDDNLFASLLHFFHCLIQFLQVGTRLIKDWRCFRKNLSWGIVIICLWGIDFWACCRAQQQLRKLVLSFWHVYLHQTAHQGFTVCPLWHSYQRRWRSYNRLDLHLHCW